MASNGISLTPALEDAIVSQVRRGVPPATAAVAGGIAHRTLNSWMLAAQRGHWDAGDPVDPASLEILARFSRRVAEAQAAFEAEVVANIAQAGTEYNQKTGQRDWRAHSWLLNNHPAYRQTYREHRELKVESHSSVSHELRLVREMSDDQLLALAGPDIAGLLEAPAGPESDALQNL